MKKWGLYECSVILFFLAVPLVLIGAEVLLFGFTSSLTGIGLKWFVFSGIGLRLGSAGIKQVANPQFTAKEIFNVQDDAALPLVKEIGVANTSFAIIALLSLFVSAFRIPAAIAGGSYYCLAGLLHLFKRKVNSEEWFAMISDFFIFSILCVCVITNLM